MNFLLKLTTSLFMLLLQLMLLQELCCAENQIANARLINCTTANISNECPDNSKCSKVVNDNSNEYRCQCSTNYTLNPLYKPTNVTTELNSNISVSNQSNVILTTAYCLLNAILPTTPMPSSSPSSSSSSSSSAPSESSGTAIVRIYKRQPAKVEHMAIGILLVLFVAIAAVALLYLLKISHPIKRSKAAYTRLKRRRDHRQRLEEFCEDDICMIQLNEKR